MELTRQERWILSNQFRILELLDPDQADDFAKVRDAIESGYELAYGWYCQHIYEETMPEDQGRFVIDVLAMFDSLKVRYDQLEDKSGIEEWRIQFGGFDGNNESDYLGFARFLFNDGKFRQLNVGDNYNSHMPTVKRYESMLGEFGRSADKNHLTKDDIIRIISVN